MRSRLNPVALVTGAAAGIGAACARHLARHASGGLILVDADEANLAAAADMLIDPPERVSTLAFDIAEKDRWTQAAEFIRGQYGRLDWAVLGIEADQRSAGESLPEVALSVIAALAPLMRSNISGGAIALALSAHAVKADLLLQLVRVAAKKAGAHNVRVNALLNGAVESPLWRRDATFEVLRRDAGDDVGALEKLARLPTPLARCTGRQDVPRLVRLLLADDSSATGATLVVDASYPL